MRRFLRHRLNRWAFRRAQAQAEGVGMVCATIARSGRPIYFVMPHEATEEAVASRAFELREGRGQLPIERTFEAYAKQWLARHRSGS
jgi:hypothetical protein